MNGWKSKSQTKEEVSYLRTNRSKEGGDDVNPGIQHHRLPRHRGHGLIEVREEAGDMARSQAGFGV